MQAARGERERRTFMKYLADSLHYLPQGQYLVDKWGEETVRQEAGDPMEVAERLSAEHGIEVI